MKIEYVNRKMRNIYKIIKIINKLVNNNDNCLLLSYMHPEIDRMDSDFALDKYLGWSKI
jgi:hypothetical protein